MPDVVEPGSRLVQRYRLDDYLGGPSTGESVITTNGGTRVKGATYWRAHDEVLDRSVGVCLLRGGNSYSERVLAAARAAAVLTDARFLRVLDAAEADGMVYVVSEWVPARTLTDLLADGPLPATAARDLGIEISAALASAHASGLTHMSLQPDHVLQTAHGQIKVAGLAVDAAARGLHVEDRDEASRRDTEGAAAVVYAALTGRWPGPEHTSLPAAPRDGTSVCSPRQVRAGVPDDLDDLVCRALGVPGRHGRPPMTSVQELHDGLTAAQPGTRLPLPGPAAAATVGLAPTTPATYPAAGPGSRGGPHDVGGDYGLDGLDRVAYADQASARPRPRAAVVAWAVVVLVLVTGVALIGSQVVTGLGGRDGQTQGASGGGDDPAAPPAATVETLEVEASTSFDPPPGNGEENSDRSGLAVDGDRSTAWTTKRYLQQFGPGGLKNGVGLSLDLGATRDLSEVRVLVRGGATDLQLRTAEEPGRTLEDYQLVKEQTNVDGRAVLRPKDPVQARYVLIWLTKLPAVDGSGYRGEIAEVTLRGSA